MRRAFILDAGAFLSGFTPGKEEEFYTVTAVLEELKDGNAGLRAEVSLQEGSLKIIDPPEAGELHKILQDTGDADQLSDTDIKLLSLSLFLREEGYNPVIVSDDYGVQNVAHKLKIDYVPTTETGIRRFIQWHKMCRGCGKKFPVTYNDVCDVCGSPLKRRAVK
jgi:UPF0271 protein